MTNNRIFKILKNFQVEDLQNFRRFLLSPYHNESQLMVDLFEYIRRYHPKFSSKKLQKERLHEAIFPEVTYEAHSKKLYNALYNLSTLAEEFLAIEGLKHNKLEQRKMLLYQYTRMEDYDWFEKELKIAFRVLNNRAVKDEEYYKELEYLNDIWYTHPHTHKNKKEVKSFKAKVESLDKYYVLAKLKTASEVLNRAKIFGSNYEIKLLEQILQVSEGLLDDENPRFKIYYFFIKAYQNDYSEFIYFSLKELFLQHASVLSKKEQNEMLTNLVNYITVLIREKKSSNEREVWELQKIGLDKGVSILQGQMGHNTFCNIVIVSTKLKEFDWAKEFIVSYAPLLKESTKHSTLTLSWAYYYFNKEEYDRVIETLRDIDFLDYFVKTQTKSLLLRSYYELINPFKNALYEVFLAQINAFDKFLRRNNKAAQARKVAYLNFVSLLKVLAKRKISVNKKISIEKLKIKLTQTKQIMARSWFQDKIDQIEKREKG